jgi:protein phosphatase
MTTAPRSINLPALSLVVLVGPSGSGKSTFARKHFRPSEVLSSDFFRAVVRDDENDQSASKDAFEVLHLVARKRLAAGLLTVVDATNVQPEARRPLIDLAREHHVFPIAICLDAGLSTCIERNRARADRPNAAHFVHRQHADYRRSLRGRSGRGLLDEGFRFVHVLDEAEAETVRIERTPMWSDRRAELGPFDLVGDVHGCLDELRTLLERLGYVETDGVYRHPEGRRVVFLGDLVDRGPRNLDVLRLAMAMTKAGTALCVPGNHDVKFMRALRGKNVRRAHGLEITLAEFEALPEADREAFRAEAADWIDGLVSHMVLDGGRLVAAHAGMRAEMQGRGSGAVREFALYGDTTGEIDSFGLPVRHDWAAHYRGEATVVYGHTPTPEAEWVNRTVCIDQGCVFGGRLTALRWPEREFVDVAAARVYCEPARPFTANDAAAAEAATAAMATHAAYDLGDVVGRRTVRTRLGGGVVISAEESAAALEAVSRFAADPRWLVYVPPTMSPSETTSRPGMLEHPAEAFAYYRSEGQARVVCEEKHMGSRAVVVLARDADAARRRFRVDDGRAGIVLSRTGREFFSDRAVEEALLARLRAACDATGFWENFATDWFLFDAELMPWSAKAQALLRGQYAAVGAAARMTLSAAEALIGAAAARGIDVGPEAERLRVRRAKAEAFVAAYGRYCWDVASVDDLRLAPFHLLAAESGTGFDRPHRWHMTTLAELAAADPSGVVMATRWREVDLSDLTAEAEATAWWESLTAAGGEGMVVKPETFVAKGRRGYVQPAVKCRGPEYLRIIYGPEYDLPEHLERLRKRGVGGKRALASREFALGVEGVERFLKREPLRAVHECAFGVLALESDPLDPRL